MYRLSRLSSRRRSYFLSLELFLYLGESGVPDREREYCLDFFLAPDDLEMGVRERCLNFLLLLREPTFSTSEDRDRDLDAGERDTDLDLDDRDPDRERGVRDLECDRGVRERDLDWDDFLPSFSLLFPLLPLSLSPPLLVVTGSAREINPPHALCDPLFRSAMTTVGGVLASERSFFF